ncbi:MAG: tyrosine-protein phosphatase, partial [Porphyromonas sp.]|nr:tyrosine-protein phosphatase [Porphyromonas sp.]
MTLQPMKVNHIIFIALLLLSFLAVGCAKSTYNVATNCDKNQVGNYVIKWEVTPAMPGKVNIYVSDRPEFFPNDPAMIMPIGENTATFVTTDNLSQKYFLLEFEGKISTVAAMRHLPMSQTPNFRDAGGYVSEEGLNMRWGRLFRSGKVRSLSTTDSLTFVKLGIRSILSLDEETASYSRRPNHLPPGVQILSAKADKPVNYSEFLSKVYSGTANGEDIRDFKLNASRVFAFNSRNQFTKAFQYLLDESNYPIIITDNLGKDRVAFFFLVVHSAIGIPGSAAIDDCLLSNRILD